MTFKSRLWMFCALALLASSCAILESTRVDLTKSPANEAIRRNTIAYFLPTGRLRLQMYTPEKSTECVVKVSESYVADPTKLYFVEYRPSIFSDDKIVKVTVDPKTGLLSAIETDTEDKTPKIIAGLAELARAVLRIPPTTRERLAAPCFLDKTFNPFDDTEKNEVLRLVRAINPSVTGLQFTPLKTEVTGGGSVNESWSTGNFIEGTQPGVFHRPVLPYQFTVEFEDNAVQPATIVYLPNKAPILRIDIKRAAFVENKYTINFENGILKDIQWVKPSEALGFIDIPLEIARAVAAIPGQLLTVKVQDLNAEKGLLEAQKNLIQAQLELKAKQKEIEAAATEN